MTGLYRPSGSRGKFAMRVGFAALCVLAVAGGVIVSGHGRYLAQVLGGKPHTVKVTWTPSKSPGVAGYNVYRGTQPGGQMLKVNREAIKMPEYIDHDVEGGRTYYYGITAVDGKNIESTRTPTITVTVPKP